MPLSVAQKAKDLSAEGDYAGVIFKTVMLTSSLLAMDLRQGKAVSLHIDPADIHLI